MYYLVLQGWMLRFNFRISCASDPIDRLNLSRWIGECKNHFSSQEKWKWKRSLSYRPTLIIPVVVKVFKRIVYDQLYRYLNENKLLCCFPSGFPILHATVTAVIKATDVWSLNVDRSFCRCICRFRL